MKVYYQTFLLLLISVYAFPQIAMEKTSIDRKAVVERHKIITTTYDSLSPAQVGNGEFAYGVDFTGLQTFAPFNTMSHWGWHSNPLPKGLHVDDFKGLDMNTHGRMINYFIQNKQQPVLSDWLAGNPHRFNLGRIGLLLLKSDGTEATIEDIKDTYQEVDMWRGIIKSCFVLEGKKVTVETACHPSLDAIGVTVESELVNSGQIKVFIYFPYADSRNGKIYPDGYKKSDTNLSIIEQKNDNSAVIARKMDDTKFFVSLNWTSTADLLPADTISSPNRFYLNPLKTNEIAFTCTFSPIKSKNPLPTANEVFEESTKGWKEYWESGAAIDLSQSKDIRWRELERRIVLSEYLVKVNEAGSLPPQEGGLVHNPWYGRYHFEMIWWHGVQFALWNRWPLVDKYLHVYKDFLAYREQLTKEQGYKGVRWPKCTSNIDRDWPHPMHALLIWQQPHPIYFAELDYRLHPTKETLEKWKDIVSETAEFMADFAYYEKTKDRYILGPPIHIMSENTIPEKTYNPAFELGYWRFGLRTAQVWRERLGLNRDQKWDDVLNKLSPLPQENGVYVTYEGIDSMWTKYNYEHPGIIGTYGMLPGDGVDINSFKKTLDNVICKWDFSFLWGWDFPMLAMAAARTGNPKLAVDMLFHYSEDFQFDEHGLASGGPFPYFSTNSSLLAAVAMMAAGWDGSEGEAPGFPKDGSWVVKYENFNKMP